MQLSSQFVNLRKVPDERQLMLRAQRKYGIMSWNWSPLSVPTLLLHILNWMVRFLRLSCQDKWPISHTLQNWDGSIGSSSSSPLQVTQNPRKYLDDGLDQPSTLVLQGRAKFSSRMNKLSTSRPTIHSLRTRWQTLLKISYEQNWAWL